jgi:hypothetical protein
MTEEQRKAWQERMKNMTPEERERFEKMREGRRRDRGGRGGENPGGGGAAPAESEKSGSPAGR